MSKGEESGVGVDRDDIKSEKVADLTAEELIRLFTLRLGTFNKRNNLSRSRCIGEIAVEFRDDYQVNILRILDEYDYQHPDGLAWNIEPIGDDTIAKFDPVTEEAKKEGGTADFREGDIIELDGNALLIVGVGDTHLVGMNESGEMAKHSLATVRELFKLPDENPRLIRDDEIIRGAKNVQ